MIFFGMINCIAIIHIHKVYRSLFRLFHFHTQLRNNTFKKASKIPGQQCVNRRSSLIVRSFCKQQSEISFVREQTRPGKDYDYTHMIQRFARSGRLFIELMDVTKVDRSVDSFADDSRRFSLVILIYFDALRCQLRRD